MKKDDIMSKKERQANKEMAYVFLFIAIMMIMAAVLELLGVFLLPKNKTLIACSVIVALSLIPTYIILVLKLNGRWVKYMVISTICIITGVCFTVFTFHIIIILCAPVMIASVYNNKKLLYVTFFVDVVVMLIAHIIAPSVTVNIDDPLYTVEMSLLYGFLPRTVLLMGVFVVSYFNVCRFNNTINNVLEYGEDLEKSTNAMKRIFIESHQMLMAENREMFIQSIGGALFRIVKFLKGNRENVKCLIVLKSDIDQFMAIDEKYERADEAVHADDKFLYVKYDGKDIKVVRHNYQNEGNCVKWKDALVMTFYEKDELEGFIVVDSTLDMNVSSNSVTMRVLYNSIKLCISTKQAEKIMVDSQEKLIYAFSQISESKSKETGQHIRRVSEYMRVFGKSICKTHKECDNLACASMLHDVGKLIVPSEVLDKPGRLTDEEFKIIKEHTKYGGQLLKDVPGDMMHMAKNISMQHHERWDGNGYHKLKGEEIDFYSRYVSVIDVFDALISKRCYKPAWSLEEAYDEIVKNAGTQFAPEAVELFKEKFDELVEVYNTYPD